MRRIIEGVILALASLVMTTLAIEIVFRTFLPQPYSIERNMYFEPDPHTGFRNRPNSVGYFQDGIPAVVNENGHRDDHVPIVKPEGVFRILVLGDSFTVGANVRQEEAYPQLLEETLSRRCTSRVEVINAGVAGWSPFQYVQYLDHYGIRFRPDLVLVGFYVGNDAHNSANSAGSLPTAVQGRRLMRDAARSQTASVRVWLIEHSHVARLLFAKSPAVFAVKRKNCRSLPKHYVDLQRQHLPVHAAAPRPQQLRCANGIAQMERMKSIGPADTRYVVALLPDEIQINRELQRRLIEPQRNNVYDLRMPQRYLLPALRRLGIATIDLLDAFLMDDRCLYMNDTHWTAEGHEVAARVIAEALLPLLPCDAPVATRIDLDSGPES